MKEHHSLIAAFARSHGNVIGGHLVEQLPDRHFQLESNQRLMAGDSKARGCLGGWPRGHFPHAQRDFNGSQPNPLRVDATPTLPTAAPTALATHRPVQQVQALAYNTIFRPHLSQPTYQSILPANDHSIDHVPGAPQFGGFMTSQPPLGMVTPEPSDVDEPKRSATFASANNHAGKLTKATQFALGFAENFHHDAAAVASFEALCARYNQKEMDETDLYVGVYRILFRTGSLHLLDGLGKLLPPRWLGVDLSWLHKAIETDFQNNPGGANKENEQMSKPQLPKKKRPINGFRTSHNLDASPSRSALVKLPVSLRATSTPATPSERAVSSSPTPNPTPTHKRRQQGRPRLVKLPVKAPKPTSSPLSTTQTQDGKKKARTPKTIPAKRVAEATLDSLAMTSTASVKGKLRYTALNGSEVPHVGPVFPTRRAVLSRNNRPYIHAACGHEFAHPQDVKAHERKARAGAGCTAAGKEWDDHPSCKADYPQLNYAQVKDGYVILDQESFDKLEAAIATGLRHHESKLENTGENRHMMARVTDISGPQDGSESGDGNEHDNDEEMIDADYEEADLRVAALGLRKRSRH